MEVKEYIAIPSNKNKQHASFLKCMKIVILISQVFGLNPVLGFYEDDASKLRFTYNSGRFLYSMLSVVAQGLMALFFTLKFFREPSEYANNFSGVNFFCSAWVLSILFLELAKKWPKLCHQISKVETFDPITDKNLVRRCNVTCIGFLIVAALEHGFNNLIEISRAMACEPDRNPIAAYIERDFEWISIYIPYSPISGAILKLINIQSNFYWNYSSVFIICICCYLTARIQQINDRISYGVKEQAVPPSYWRILREDYTQTTFLIKQVDRVINSITFVSFSSNLYSTCFHVHRTFRDGFIVPVFCGVNPADRLLKGYEYILYYAFSLSFLFFRTLALTLVAARVNTTSVQTAFGLYDVTSEDFSIEVKRFIDQVQGNSVALSGLRLFSIKRNIVLTIAATMVTYELVLIQYTTDEN